jgi:hypothetical protein
LASQILSRNLRCLSSDWQKRYGHPIALVETFVDPERFEGTCYRAANWKEIGVTKGFGRSRLDFYQIHDKPKAIFVYPLIAEACEILCAPEMPPDWAPYERIANPKEYPLSGQQTKSLVDALQEGLTDPRRYKRGRVHRKVASIVAIATAAIIAGNNSIKTNSAACARPAIRRPNNTLRRVKAPSAASFSAWIRMNWTRSSASGFARI